MKAFKDISKPLLGILIYTVAPLIRLIISTGFDWTAPVMFLGLILIFWGLYEMPNVHHHMYGKNGLMNLLFGFYVVLLIVMFLRGPSYWYRAPGASLTQAVTAYLCSPYYFIWIIMPMVVLRMYPNYSLKGLIRLVCGVCVICCLFTIFNFRELLSFSLMSAFHYDTEESLSKFMYARIGLEFAALVPISCYLSKRQRIIVYITFAVNILTCILLARRGALAMSLLLVLFSFWLSFKDGNATQRRLVLLATVSLVLFFFLANNTSLFGYLHERLLLDNRSEVDETLMAQMNDWEKLFGKGLNGRYYLPYGAEDDPFNGWRYSSETGFFTIVLRGGYLMAIVYLVLMLVPAYLGMFRSNNRFCRAGGVFILWNIIYLYPFGVLTFNLNFFFIWMWVILCSLPQIRNMRESDIRSTFFGAL